MVYHLESSALKEISNTPGNLIQSMGGKVQAAYNLSSIFQRDYCNSLDSFFPYSVIHFFGVEIQ